MSILDHLCPGVSENPIHILGGTTTGYRKLFDGRIICPRFWDNQKKKNLVSTNILWCNFFLSRSTEYFHVSAGVCLIPWHFLWPHISDMFDWSYVIAGFVTSVWFMMGGRGKYDPFTPESLSIEQKLLPIHSGLHLILHLITFQFAQWIMNRDRFAKENIFDESSFLI